MRPEFDDSAGPQGVYQPEGEWNMSQPGGRSGSSFGQLEDQRVN